MSLSNYRAFDYVFILLNILFFSGQGCCSRQAAPVVTLNPLISVIKGDHIVSERETLYSIAWRYHRDYKELATINNIVPPYYLKVGQRLNLQVPNVPKSQSTWSWPTTGKIIKTFSNELNRGLKSPLLGHSDARYLEAVRVESGQNDGSTKFQLTRYPAAPRANLREPRKYHGVENRGTALRD